MSSLLPPPIINPRTGKQFVIAFALDLDGTLLDGDSMMMFEQDVIDLFDRDLEIPRFYSTLGKTYDLHRLHPHRNYNRDLLSTRLFIQHLAELGVPMTHDLMLQLGRHLKVAPGVLDTFKHIKEVAAQQGAKAEIYIISGGHRPYLMGSELMEWHAYGGDEQGNNKIIETIVSAIWACEPLGEDFRDDSPIGIFADVIGKKNKFDVLLKIMAGSNLDASLKDIPVDIREGRILPEHLWYFGDGPTDIFAWWQLKHEGGNTAAVYFPGDDVQLKRVEGYKADGYVTEVLEADYSLGGPVDRLLTNFIIASCQEMVISAEVAALERTQMLMPWAETFEPIRERAPVGFRNAPLSEEDERYVASTATDTLYSKAFLKRRAEGYEPVDGTAVARYMVQNHATWAVDLAMASQLRSNPAPDGLTIYVPQSSDGTNDAAVSAAFGRLRWRCDAQRGGTAEIAGDTGQPVPVGSTKNETIVLPGTPIVMPAAQAQSAVVIHTDYGKVRVVRSALSQKNFESRLTMDSATRVGDFPCR